MGRYDEYKKVLLVVYLPPLIAFLISLALYVSTRNDVVFIVTFIVFSIVFVQIAYFMVDGV